MYLHQSSASRRYGRAVEPDRSFVFPSNQVTSYIEVPEGVGGVFFLPTATPHHDHRSRQKDLASNGSVGGDARSGWMSEAHHCSRSRQDDLAPSGSVGKDGRGFYYSLFKHTLDTKNDPRSLDDESTLNGSVSTKSLDSFRMVEPASHPGSSLRQSGKVGKDGSVFSYSFFNPPLDNDALHDNSSNGWVGANPIGRVVLCPGGGFRIAPSQKINPLRVGVSLSEHAGSVLDMDGVGAGGVGQVIHCPGGGFRIAFSPKINTPFASSEYTHGALDTEEDGAGGLNMSTSKRKRQFAIDVSVGDDFSAYSQPQKRVPGAAGVNTSQSIR
jgi:hypothetical protein